MSQTKNCKRRRKLFIESPLCHWCGEKVHFFDHEDGKKISSSAATLDHYYAKGDSRREGRMTHSVLCCFRCNNARGDMRPERWEYRLKMNSNSSKGFNKNIHLTSKIYELIPLEIKLKLNNI